jgi:hypothetical protein
MSALPADLDARLRRARTIDWRFALPDPVPTSVATIGRVSDEMEAAMADAGWHQTPADADLALTIDPDRDALREARRALAPAGTMCVIWRRASVGMGRRGVAGRSTTARSLRKAGFDVRWHVLVPNASETSAIVPLSTPAPLALLLGRRSGLTGSRAARWLAETLRRHGLLVELAPAALLIARRQPAPDAISAHLAALRRRDPGMPVPDGHGDPLLLTPRFRASRHVVALVPGPDATGSASSGTGDPALVLKVARLADGGEVARREAKALESMAARPAELGSPAPSLVDLGSPWGLATIVETAVAGRPLDPATVRRDPERAIAIVSDWLVSMVKPVAGQPAGERISRLVWEPMASFTAAWSDDADRRFIDATKAAATALRSASLPIAFEHGDASHPNLVRRPDGSLAAVDWELAEPDGLPLHDLTTFLAYVAVARGRASPSADQGREIAASLLAVDGWAGRALAEHAQRIGLEGGCIRPLVILSLARLTMGMAERLEDTRSSSPSQGTVDWLRQHRYHVAWRSAALALDAR